MNRIESLTVPVHDNNNWLVLQQKEQQHEVRVSLSVFVVVDVVNKSIHPGSGACDVCATQIMMIIPTVLTYML
jgi:uncharacterized membrane protein